jgi:hypothetical protein
MNLEDKTLIHYSLLGANHPHPHHHHHHFVCSVARKNWLEEEEEEEKKRKGKKLSKNNVVVEVVYSQLGYSTVGAISLFCFAMSVCHVGVP